MLTPNELLLATLGVAVGITNKHDGVLGKILSVNMGVLGALTFYAYSVQEDWHSLFVWPGLCSILIFTVAITRVMHDGVSRVKPIQIKWGKWRKLNMDPIAIFAIKWGLVGSALGFIVFSGGALLYKAGQYVGAPSAKEIAREMRGEGNFCYLSLYFIGHKPVDTNGQFQLAMTSRGIVEKLNYWISPWGAEPTGQPNDPYYSLDFRKPLVEIVHDGGRAWERALPVGEYRIDFNAMNGNWHEYLKIYSENGEIRQEVKVTTANGKVLYEYPETTKPKKNIKKQ